MKKYITSGLLILASFSFIYAEVTDTDTSSSNSCAIISQNLRYLSRDTNGSTDVSILQDFLNGRGYLKSQPTGFFGSATRRAVIAFQNDNGLRATPPGYVGPGTRAKIQQVDCSDDNTTSNTQPSTTPSVTSYQPQEPQNCPSVMNPYYQYSKETNSCYYAGSGTSGCSKLATYQYVSKESCEKNNINHSQSSVTSPAPQITSIDCKGSCYNLQMPINGQSIIHGNYLSGVTSVFLGNRQLEGVQVYNDNSVNISIPTWVKAGTYNLYLSGGNGTSNTVSVTVTDPSVTSLPTYTPPTITVFGNKDPNPTTGATVIMWNTSKVASNQNGFMDVTLDVSCITGSISFTTDKGNNPDCSKGGIWAWSNTNADSITVTPVGNTVPVTVPFTLTLNDPSGVSSKRQTQTINITFPTIIKPKPLASSVVFDTTQPSPVIKVYGVNLTDVVKLEYSANCCKPTTGYLGLSFGDDTIKYFYGDFYLLNTAIIGLQARTVAADGSVGEWVTVQVKK